MLPSAPLTENSPWLTTGAGENVWFDTDPHVTLTRTLFWIVSVIGVPISHPKPFQTPLKSNVSDGAYV